MSPVLNTGITFAIFKFSGNILFPKDKVKGYGKGSQSLLKQPYYIGVNFIMPRVLICLNWEKKNF